MTGFTFSTTSMLTNAKDLFVTFGSPILGIAGGIALFAGLFQVVVGALRSAWR
jgi:hypothetical protein